MSRPPVFDLIVSEQRKVRDIAREREQALRNIGQSEDGKIIMDFLREIADGQIYHAEADAASMAFADGQRVLALTLIRHMNGGRR